MHMGERFCMAGKRPRKFKNSDPKIYVPAWCPKRKSPKELRIYGFKSANDWYIHQGICKHMGKDVLPSDWRYAVESELSIELSAQDFWNGLKTETPENLLGTKINCYQVVEIDDGVDPVFFYCTDKGVQVLSFFNANKARNNRKED